MEIKSSAPYQASPTPLSATEKSSEASAKGAGLNQTQSAATDSVTISAEAKALLDAEAAPTVPPVKAMNDGEPPPWPPTTDD